MDAVEIPPDGGGRDPSFDAPLMDYLLETETP